MVRKVGVTLNFVSFILYQAHHWMLRIFIRYCVCIMIIFDYRCGTSNTCILHRLMILLLFENLVIFPMQYVMFNLELFAPKSHTFPDHQYCICHRQNRCVLLRCIVIYIVSIETLRVACIETIAWYEPEMFFV